MSGAAKFKNHVKISERHGAGEWLTERVLMALLMPLSVWVLSSIFTLAGSGYGGAVAWFASPLNATLAAATLVIFFAFAALAWKNIIDDYIHKPGTKGLLIGLTYLVALGLAAASVFFIVRLALGSAPLPAGLGA